MPCAPVGRGPAACGITHEPDGACLGHGHGQLRRTCFAPASPDQDQDAARAAVLCAHAVGMVYINTHRHKVGCRPRVNPFSPFSLITWQVMQQLKGSVHVEPRAAAAAAAGHREPLLHALNMICPRRSVVHLLSTPPLPQSCPSGILLLLQPKLFTS